MSSYNNANKPFLAVWMRLKEMMMAKNKVVALDIGNVCLHITPERAFDYFGRHDFWQPEMPLAQAAGELECGRLSEQDFLARAQELIGGHFSLAEIQYGWNLIIGEEVDGMAAFVQSMREEGFRLVFFSDTSALHMREVQRKLSFFDLVHDGVYSYDVGARKPHQRMYEDFERRHGRPDYYFDDRIGNIEAARQRGWPAFQFDSIASAWAAVGGSCG
ncbi:MAG: HAD family hydrolase [Lentisphaeria bacterium]